MQLSSKLCRRIISVGAVLIALFLVDTASAENSDKDPHRPQCADARCRTIKSFLKAHYCGQSPFGNGPDDGCEIKSRKKSPADFDALADFKCEWKETTQARECQQHGQPSTAVRDTVLRELHRLRLPPRDDKGVLFAVWKPASSGWVVAQGSYSQTVGSTLHICDVILVIDPHLHVTVLRKVPFQKTDADVPTVTTWSLIDIADVDGDNVPDIILEGDAYENHWLEVVSMHDSSWKTTFSGLGYYL